jgi:hypothetical protein
MATKTQRLQLEIEDFLRQLSRPTPSQDMARSIVRGASAPARARDPLRDEVVDLVTTLRGPKRIPIEEVIDGFRGADIRGRRPGRETARGARGVAFDRLSAIAEDMNVTILDLLDEMRIK